MPDYDITSASMDALQDTVRMDMSELEEQMVGSLRLNRLPPGEREYRFAIRRAAGSFDFAWPGAKVALEVEGGTWTHGRHNRGVGMEKDAEKYNQAA